MDLEDKVIIIGSTMNDSSLLLFSQLLWTKPPYPINSFLYLYERISLLNKKVVISTQSVVYHFGNITVGKGAYSNSNNSNKLYTPRNKALSKCFPIHM